MTLPEARRIAGFTQNALDDAASLTRGTVTDIERGKNKNPSHEVVTRIVRAFQERGLAGVTADELFPISESKKAVAS